MYEQLQNNSKSEMRRCLERVIRWSIEGLSQKRMSSFIVSDLQKIRKRTVWCFWFFLVSENYAQGWHHNFFTFFLFHSAEKKFKIHRRDFQCLPVLIIDCTWFQELCSGKKTWCCDPKAIKKKEVTRKGDFKFRRTSTKKEFLHLWMKTVDND